MNAGLEFFILAKDAKLMKNNCLKSKGNMCFSRQIMFFHSKLTWECFQRRECGLFFHGSFVSGF